MYHSSDLPPVPAHTCTISEAWPPPPMMEKCLAWSGGLPLSSFVVRAESRNQSNESSKSRLPAELLEPAELQNDGWRLREIKNIRGLYGNKFYFKFYRPRKYKRIYGTNIRQNIRSNIRGIFGANIRGNIRPEFAGGPAAGRAGCRMWPAGRPDVL